MIRKSNPYHDERGRFTFGAGGLSVGSRLRCGGKTYTIKRAIPTKTGRVVFAAYNRREREEDENIGVCEILIVKLGWTCVLLPRSSVLGEKTADMMRVEDKTKWEIKTSYSGNPQTISKALQKASKQATNAIVKIVCKDSVNMEAIKKAARNRKALTKLEKIMFIVDENISFLDDED